jgi:hypothetical protein
VALRAAAEIDLKTIPAAARKATHADQEAEPSRL